MMVLIKESIGMLIYLVVIHGLTISTLWLIEIDLMLSSLLSVLIGFSLFVYYCQYRGVMGQKKLTKLHVDNKNKYLLDFSDNTQEGPYSLKGSVIFNVALILYLRSDNRFLSKPVFIPKDAVDDKAWRQLRVRLRDPDSWV